ncbi:MAG TPA: glycine/sarcosine/betaine reductase selenoprotein B family protein [Anaerolineales bacterium]|jgi:D-proline reductase (dithiol) PrdB
MPVDSYKYLDILTRQMALSWIKMAVPGLIPWTPLSRPLADCTVALVSSGGIAQKTDLPFDQESERKNPWWGDPTYRVIPRSVTEQDVEIYHLHINPNFARQDLNCLLPIQRLNELETERVIGKSAMLHYSYMGYILQPQTLLEESVPQIIRSLRDERVDIVVLVPA